MTKIFKIILRFKGKDYECEGFCWEDTPGVWRSAYENDSVRNCEHDYACLLPEDVQGDIDFGCEQKEIEVIDYWFEDKK